MTLIGTHFGLSAPKPYVVNTKPLPNKLPTLLYGVELEIERIPHYDECIVPGLRVEPDGSLRNNGMEFITKPMNYTTLQWVLDMFFKKAKLSEANYSERTSIHVHTNCQDITFDQLQVVLMVYQIYERLLYAFVGGDRDKNIFCVPWHQTVLQHGMFNDIKDGTNMKGWQKYTGLNLLPLFEQGTIEWRHMPGHCNLERIMMWCNIISAIYRYASVTTVQQAKDSLLALNTTSQYDQLTATIFEELSDEFMKIPAYKELLEEGVLDVKFGFMGKKAQKKAAAFFNYDLRPEWPRTIDPQPVEVPPIEDEARLRRLIEAERARVAEARTIRPAAAIRPNGLRTARPNPFIVPQAPQPNNEF